ncbi:MAG: hypothetical protein ABL966_01115 [Acidimicrobiales bacterium]
MAEPKSSGSSSALKRYGPIAAVAVVVVGAIVAFGGGGGGDDDVDTTPDPDQASGLPLTFQEAEEQGRDDIEWGEGCDTDRGRIAIPIRNAAPCVEPWTETDNGGATAQGVTADAIKIVVYQGEPDPLQQAIVGEAGADTDPADTAQAAVDYLRMLEDVYETYGRTLDIEIVEATGGPADATAAQADARTIIDKAPFAVLGGPAQTPVYWQELVDAEILCIGGCSLAEGWDIVEEAGPYLWPTGLAPEQADAHLVEMVGKQLVGKPAEFAGDPELQTEERVFGWVQAETETGEYTARNDAFDQQLQEEYGGEVVTRSTYLFDPAAAQETATAVVTRMRDAGVTTVLMSVDPLIPATITAEATKQGYFPEWVIGPSVLADTTIFGRTFDQEQWAHAIGISLPSARAATSLSDAFFVYDWYYGEPAPVNTVNVVLPAPAQLLLGIHLAGPELSPATFEQGLFRYPPVEGGGKTFSHVSWGEDLWGRVDYNSSDDASVIWWDPAATGEDEAGNEGTGMLRYVDGGTRYLPGEWPTEPIAFFENEGSVTVYDELPESDSLPDYPPWPGSPAAG